MKILFIALYNDFTFRRREEIGICHISAYLAEKGYETKVTSNRHTSFDVDEIVEYAPDLVGFPVYSANKKDVIDFCLQIKALLPNVKIVLGGYLPTYFSRELMAEAPCVDFITRGEGEIVTLQLIQALESGGPFENIKALTYRSGDKIIKNEGMQFIENLDAMPFPSRELLSKDHSDFAVIQSSRGCKGHCTFCACPDFWTDKTTGCSFRGRSVQNMVMEIEQIIANTGITAFMITDQSFEDSPDNDFNKVEQFAQTIINKKLKISYHISFRATFYKHMDEHIIKLLKDSGLVSIFVGIETFNTDDLKVYGKMAKLEDNIAMINTSRKYDIDMGVGFINLNPYSNIQRLKVNLSYLKEFGLCSTWMISSKVAVFKGTRLFYALEKQGLLIRYDDRYDEYGYNFVIPEIGVFSDFLNEQLALYANQVNSFIYYTNDFMVYFQHLKRRIQNNGDAEVYDYLCDQEKKMKDVFKRMSDQCASCFEEIYMLSETVWDFHRASQRLAVYMQLEKSLLKELKQLEFDLYRVLTKHSYQEEIPKY